MSCAPVALFVYNRPRHTRQTVEALLANPEAFETPLYIFSDAPKDVAASKAVTEVRQYLGNISGFKSVSIIERGQNFGLARSIIDGVTQVCRQYGKIIVLEDDIVVSRYFLQFMNDGLQFYESDERLISISGYVYPMEAKLPDTFLLKGADCWGWATWTRAWNLFEPDGKVLLQGLEEQGLTYAFDSNGTYPFTQMLRNQIKGKNNSWAIRWHATAFLSNKFTLYPGRTLVHNIGVDGSGANCAATDIYSGDMTTNPVAISSIRIEENKFAREQIVLFHKRWRSSLPIRIFHRLKKLFSKSEK